MNATSTEERFLGNYRLLRLLGRGGQALVYLGQHRYLNRLAAIKVLRASLNEKKEQQFRREAQLLANLSHQHIIHVLEFGIEEKKPFLVMDYARQGSVLTLFLRGSCHPLEKVVDYIAQIASALHYAHSKHIIHRDIKPENLLLNERQRIMISDFGLALLAPRSQHDISTPGMAGTLPYMAPEQLYGRAGYASDQYALGIVTYEWLCGQHPFIGSLAEMIYQLSSAPPPSLRKWNLALSQEVEAVILKALAKDPTERYPDVVAFAEALAQASQVNVTDRQEATHGRHIFAPKRLMHLHLPALGEPKKVLTAPMPAVLPSSGLSLKKSGKRWKLQSDSQGEHVEQLPETLAPSQVPGPFTHIAERRGGRETRKPKRKTASPEHRAVRDDLGMMRQLGVIPAPANAG